MIEGHKVEMVKMVGIIEKSGLNNRVCELSMVVLKNIADDGEPYTHENYQSAMGASQNYNPVKWLGLTRVKERFSTILWITCISREVNCIWKLSPNEGYQDEIMVFAEVSSEH